MKKIVLTFIIIFLSMAFLHGKSYAYTTISGSEAYEIFSRNEELVVVDVREDYEFCPYHIPCAINYPWNSGVFSAEYNNLPDNVTLLLVCASGVRSSRAAAVLSSNGYETVYSLSGGISSWPATLVSCDDIENCEPTYPLYFPHIASGDGWETEIAIINTSTDTPLKGTFKVYDSNGELLDNTLTLDLPAAGRTELLVGDFFPNPTAISYIILSTNSETVYGYLKFYNSPGLNSRVAIPASASLNLSDISVSHIALNDGWWTGLALLNTTDEDRNMTFTFNNGQSKSLTLKAGNYQSLIMSEFLENLSKTEINSAVISNAEGVVGLEIFGNGNQLSGVRLRDTTSQSLYYPHVVSDQIWWTGIVAFNPGQAAGELIIKPYSADGTLLTPADPATPTAEALRLISPPTAATPIEIGSRERFIGSASGLNLPEGTAWLKIETSVPVSGFELFGTTDGLQLAGYTSVGIDGYSGVFPKLETLGWSGVALVNTTTDAITVILNAYKNDGSLVATTSLPLNGHQRIAGPPDDLFNDDIDTASYITYSATAPVVAFQLNGNGNMLDALPGRQ